MGSEPSIVSLWADPDKQGEFLCSGLLLTPQHILTAGHAFESWPQGRPVFVRLIHGVEGDVEAKLLHRNDHRDAAILELVTAAGRDVRPRLLAVASESFDGRRATLWVIDPDSFGCSIASNYAVNGFDHRTGEFVISPENARGHSGGVVEVDGQIIGLLSRRTPSDPLCRAVGMHLLWPWIRDTLGQPIAAPSTSRSPTVSAVSAAYLALVDKVRERVRERLKRGGMELLARRWGADPLASFDKGEPEVQLATLLDGLYIATRDSIPEWRRESGDLLAEIKADCRAIVSELVKLAVDPAPGNPEQNFSTVAATPPQRLHLACQFSGTADAVYFALGDLPNILERRLKEPDIASAQAVHLDELIPAGEGEDLRQALLRKLWTRVMGDELPARIDDKLERQLMARIRRHDGRDQRRYLLAARGPSAWIAESQYADWAQALHIGLVLYEDGECPYLLVEEPDLIDSVREYLELVEDC